jgi:hypothetical protein
MVVNKYAMQTPIRGGVGWFISFVGQFEIVRATQGNFHGSNY